MSEETRHERVMEAARKEYDEDFWEHHIRPVINYSLELGKLSLSKKEISEEGMEVVELAAAFHDSGIKKYGREKHEKTGAEIAKIALKEFGYSDDFIKEVKDCIKSHRTSGEPKTKTAEIVRSADGMAAVTDPLSLLEYAMRNKDFKDFNEAVEKTWKKIKKQWDKITIPEGREMVEKDYRDALSCLDPVKKYEQEEIKRKEEEERLRFLLNYYLFTFPFNIL